MVKATFVKAGYKAEMIKAVVDGTEEWYKCDKNVRDFAKKNFSEGDDIEFEFDVDGDDKVIEGYVKKVGGSDSPATSKASSSSKSSYKSPNESGKYKADPEKSEGIRRQCCAKSTAQTLVAMQGHVDPNNVFDLMDEIYNKYDELTK